MIAKRIVRLAMTCGLLLTLTAASIGATAENPSAPNANLIGVPASGTAPLTVNFAVGLTNPHTPLVYQWNFGDGAASSMPSGAYMLHVYQHPGTYLCSLQLTDHQGRSTSLVTTIVVKPRHS